MSTMFGALSDPCRDTPAASAWAPAYTSPARPKNLRQPEGPVHHIKPAAWGFRSPAAACPDHILQRAQDTSCRAMASGFVRVRQPVGARSYRAGWSSPRQRKQARTARTASLISPCDNLHAVCCRALQATLLAWPCPHFPPGSPVRRKIASPSVFAAQQNGDNARAGSEIQSARSPRFRPGKARKAAPHPCRSRTLPGSWMIR